MSALGKSSLSEPPAPEATIKSKPAWHALPANEVLQRLQSAIETGLSSEEVLKRRERYGPNTLQQIKPRPAWRVFVDQFVSLVVALLVVAAAISWATGETLEAIAILIVVVLNAIVGFMTEWQAGRALDALRRQARTNARVKRDNVESEIDAGELVPGDIVILNAGDLVPADSRLLEASQLTTQEAALTGESTTIQKSTNNVPDKAPLAERHSMVFLGTAIASGRGIAIVVDTGNNTELGRIGHLVSTSVKEVSPLEVQLGRLGHRVVYIVLAIAVVVMLVGWLRGDEFWTMVEVGISLAVAAVPEGLPAVTTLILALGILRMARRKAIIRRLLAVETLGSTTVICSDKTGTLTENRMTVREYFLTNGRTIETQSETPPSQNDELLQQAILIGLLSNEASLRITENKELQTLGDPTETALLVVADAFGIDVMKEREKHPKVGEQPFDASTKRMTTLHRTSVGQHFSALKGAPAVVIDACSHYAARPDDIKPLDDAARERFTNANEEMAGRALRVLGLAIKHFDQPRSEISDQASNDGYTLYGLVGMIDPPRPGVAEAIANAREAGIRVVMLTGDQLETALAIARELNLGTLKTPSGVHANALLDVDKKQLAELARSTDVFARVSPEDKLRIVEAMQDAGEIVAVTGDGVNDAPALKRANIGIAMGQRGTEVAKDASEVVLADDNFTTIVYAIEGGRTIYANISKFVHLMFTHNLGEVLVIFVATAVGWPLPLMPLQILWMNLVTDVFPALSLAMEPPSPNTMKRKPRDAQSSLLSRSLIVLIGWQSAMLAAISLLAYLWALGIYGPGEHARTICLFTLIGVQLGHLFNCRSRTRSAFSKLFSNPYIWVATAIVIALQFAAVYISPLSLVLGTSKPNPPDWAVIVGSVFIPIIIVEITKLVAAVSRQTVKP